MARRFEGDKLVIASHNPGKVAEIAKLLAPYGIETVAAGELGLPEPKETGDSFEENATLKALAAARASDLPALADDSGLEVLSLGSAPGIHSARWAGPKRDFHAAMDRVRERLKGHMDRSAKFICALALAWPDGEVVCVTGEVKGNIVWPPRGDNGFGYDPIFCPADEDETFGEMAPERKDAMSHRALAFRQLTYASFSR